MIYTQMKNSLSDHLHLQKTAKDRRDQACKQAQNILPASIVKSCKGTPKHVTINRRISLVKDDLTIHESDLREVQKALPILKERNTGTRKYRN